MVLSAFAHFFLLGFGAGLMTGSALILLVRALGAARRRWPVFKAAWQMSSVMSEARQEMRQTTADKRPPSWQDW